MARSRSAPEFVSFHTDRPAGGAGAHPHTNLASPGYLRMLDQLFRSARLFHRGAECTLLTDAATRVDGIRAPFRRVDATVDHGALMLSRTLAQQAYVHASALERPILLLDSDILLNGSLRPMLGEDFDVGVTWRASARMPINGGVLVLNNRRPDVVRAFFDRFVAIYRARYVGADAAWYGDQLALRDCIGLTHDDMRQLDVVERDGCRIRLLPCDVYNHSPDDRLAAIVDGLPGRLVVHFKGGRKRLMDPFWDCFLQPRESRWPGATWRARRALRRLAEAAAAEASPARPVTAEVDA